MVSVTVILVLLVVYLGIANWWHRYQVRKLQVLVAEQMMVLAQMEQPMTERAPTWTHTLN